MVGGGVAAAAAVLALRECGRSVAVLAPAPPSGFRIGESLSRSAEEELRKLGILDAHLEEPHLESQVRFSRWGSSELVEESAWPAAPHHGWYLDRARFNAFLWEQAETTPHQRFLSPVEKTVDHGDAWSLHLRGGGRVRGKIILDCSGRSAVIARRLANREQLDRLVAAYTVLPQIDDTIEPTVASMVESVLQGWCYSVLTPDRSLVVAFFTDSDLLPDRLGNSTDEWQALLAGCPLTMKRINTAGYRIEGAPAIVDASTRVSAEFATDRWLAAGDAAVCFDPLSSHGMTTGLWSGRVAADAADRLLAGDSTMVETYATRFRGGIDRYLQDRQRMYAVEQRWSTSPFWQRRHATPD